jgi:hypothetical protein
VGSDSEIELLEPEAAVAVTCLIVTTDNLFAVNTIIALQNCRT